MVNQYLISKLENEKRALESQIEIHQQKFDLLRKEKGDSCYSSRTFTQLCDLEQQLEKINQELVEKYAERSECDAFVKKHATTFCKFKGIYANTIAYFKDNIHLSNMLLIMFSFAFGIGLLTAFSAWFEESTVTFVICSTLLVALCIVAYIVCKKHINAYCINLAKNEHELYVQRAINNAIQNEKINELKNALLEAGLVDKYKKIEKKYENISQNIRSNDDFYDYCKLPPSD